MNLVYDEIEDWNKIFTTQEGKEINVTSSINEILVEIVLMNVNEFHLYNDYDESDYWTLYVKIYPQEERINFKSECEFVDTLRFEYDYDLSSSEEMSRTGDKPTLPQQIVDQINFLFETETPEDTKMLQFSFNGEYVEVYVYDFYVNGWQMRTELRLWSNLVDKIMTNLYGRWWADGLGARGIFKFNLFHNNLQIILDKKSKDYDMTKMDLNITTDSF